MSSCHAPAYRAMPTLSRVVALTTILALAVTPAIGKGFRFKGVRSCGLISDWATLLQRSML